jgi:hypothetical protein
MYYAQMFDYGSDPNHVGITGIVGCMGVIFAAPNRLYAVHIPDMTNSRLTGANAFVGMVQLGEGAAHPAGTLHLFVNGMNRHTADDEARTMLTPLGAPATRIYRFKPGLDPNVNGANDLAATIKVQSGGGLQLFFKNVPDDQWIAGGNARTGRYAGSMADAPTRPNDAELNAAWYQMTSATCLIRNIH